MIITVKKRENQITGFTSGIMFSLLILFIIFAGCTAKEKITKDEAIRIALNDTRTIQAINNRDFTSPEVSTAHIGIGSESQEEVYLISIKFPGAGDKQVDVFVTYDGRVALVDIPYPVIRPPDSLLNNYHSAISGWNATERNSTRLIPENVPSEIPV